MSWNNQAIYSSCTEFYNVIVVSHRSDGTQELKVMAPDTITTWQLTGLSLNSNKGLGVSDPDATGSKVRKDFFKNFDGPRFILWDH